MAFADRRQEVRGDAGEGDQVGGRLGGGEVEEAGFEGPVAFGGAAAGDATADGTGTSGGTPASWARSASTAASARRALT